MPLYNDIAHSSYHFFRHPCECDELLVVTETLATSVTFHLSSVDTVDFNVYDCVFFLRYYFYALGNLHF